MGVLNEKRCKIIIDDYSNDNELDLINDQILLDWIGEYLLLNFFITRTYYISQNFNVSY